MKNLLFIFCAWFICNNTLFAQTDTTIFINARKGADLLDAEKYDSARVYLQNAVRDLPKNAHVWYMLSIAESELDNNSEALIDINIALELSDNANYILLQRALLHLNTFNYKSAEADFTKIIDAKLNEKPKNEEEKEQLGREKARKGLAHYYRAFLYDYMKDYKKCKKDVLAAEKLGAITSKRQKDRFETMKELTRPGNYYHLGCIETQSKDPDYGFTKEKPIKVGHGLDGAASNEYIYLRRLLGADGKPIKYNRRGSCCSYKSKYALFGDFALLDHFEIEYQNEKGETVKRDLYISLYDYEPVFIPVGMKAVQPLK